MVTTALSYQESWESSFRGAALDAAHTGDYIMASIYIRGIATILGVPKEELPLQPLQNQNSQEAIVNSWRNYYIKLLEIIPEKVYINLTEVRAKYAKVKNDIPRVIK